MPHRLRLLSVPRLATRLLPLAALLAQPCLALAQQDPAQRETQRRQSLAQEADSLAAEAQAAAADGRLAEAVNRGFNRVARKRITSDRVLESKRSDCGIRDQS